MNKKSETGQIGESIAAKYLVNCGYKIVARNFRKKWGEIDIAGIGPDKIFVFIEVKTLRAAFGVKRETSGMAPEENITVAKYKKLRRMAESCANSFEFQKYIDAKKGWRIDAIAVDLYPDNSYDIRHLENI